MYSRLVSRNVTVSGHRTSLRLEQASWDALDDICRNEGVSMHDLCTMIETTRKGSSRTSTVRAFIVTYIRTMSAGTSQGESLSQLINRLAA